MNCRWFTMLGTSTGLLFCMCVVGCPAKQTVETTPPPWQAVITKADLDSLREEYVQKLHPYRSPPVGAGPYKELRLVDFREDTKAGHPAFKELKSALKNLVESKNAVVSDWRDGDRKFSFHYDQGQVHGFVTCQLMPHHNSEFSPLSWDIVLSVKEERHAPASRDAVLEEKREAGFTF